MMRSGSTAARFLQRLLAIGGGDHFVAGGLQIELDQLDRIRLVIHHEDFGFLGTHAFLLQRGELAGGA